MNQFKRPTGRLARSEPSRRAFTLIELLVVIGIIAVLVAILVPVISKMRVASATAATQNELMQISNSIQNYHNDFLAYPGVTPDSLYYTDPTKLLDPKLTANEDLVLTLMGGTYYDPIAGITAFDNDLLGKGPVSRNPANPGQKNAYLESRPGWMSPISVINPKPPKLPPDPKTLKYAKDTGEWLFYVTNDSLVPEFIDQYNDARPLLYLRANPAGKPQTKANADKCVNFTANYDPQAFYSMKPVQAYIKQSRLDGASTSESNRKDDVFAPTPPAQDQQLIKDYFTGPFMTATVAGKPRGAGSYLLISAGPDRRFGTSDDIVVSGGGVQ